MRHGGKSPEILLILRENNNLEPYGAVRSMKKSVFVFTLLFLLAGLLFGCTGQTEGSVQKLVIGYDDCKPYIYTDEDGQSAGIDVDLAKEACRRMGYTPEFRKIDWNERDTLLDSGEIDCLWSCFAMAGQEARYAWVGPYMYSRQVVAVLADSDLYGLQDLAGKSLAVKVGGRPEAIALNHSDPKLPVLGRVYCLSSMEEAVAALRGNYVDACAGYNATLTELLANETVNYRLLDEDLEIAALGVAFPRSGDGELREKLTETLEEMRTDGTTESFLGNYNLDVDKAMGRTDEYQG